MRYRQEPQLVPLTCPECRAKGYGGVGRMGNHRALCGTCNRFVQQVSRRTGKELASRHPEEQAKIREQIELDLYPQFVEDYRNKFPVPGKDDIDFDENGVPIFNA